MARLLSRRDAPGIVLGTIAVGIAAAGGSYAASSSSAPNISACVGANGGALYVAKHCRRGDRRLSWSTQGPAGSAGAPGTPGPIGPTGATGPLGVAGGSLRGNFPNPTIAAQAVLGSSCTAVPCSTTGQIAVGTVSGLADITPGTVTGDDLAAGAIPSYSASTGAQGVDFAHRGDLPARYLLHAVPPVLSDLVGACHAPKRSGQGGRDRHSKFHELPDNLDCW